MGTSILAELVMEFEGNIEFDEISRYLGIYPENHTLLSPNKIDSYRKHKSCWFIDTGYIETIELGHVLSILVKQIEGKEVLFCNLLTEYKGNCILSIIPWIAREQKPIFNFERAILDIVHKLGATIQFDIYFED